jgi:hypothetical protein
MFAGRTHTLGNFVLVPYGFNRGRYSKTQDYWDLSLDILKKDGYTTSKGKVFKTDNFSRYINTFFLWDYVYCENGQYEIKSLFSDKFQNQELDKEQIKNINERFSKGKDEKFENCEPKNDEEITNFLKNVNWAIKRRGIFMVAMLRIASMTDVSQVKIEGLEKWENWDVSIWYKLIMKEVLYQADKKADKVEIMADYNVVFEKIRDCLDGYNDLPEIQKIKEIINVAQKNINEVNYHNCQNERNH